MKFYQAKLAAKFIGRQYELQYLENLAKSAEANILVVYGRRRVGKTQLIEQSFAERNLLKFEGLEKGGPAAQRENFLTDLAKFFKNRALLKIAHANWRDIFESLADCLEDNKVRPCTVFLEELQWMANYADNLVSDLKHVWDNRLSKIPGLLLILCGSAPSFMLTKVIRSKALYNRSLHELHLKQFSLLETKQFLGFSNRQVLDAQLLIGGLPEYLKYARRFTSPYLSICHNTFKPGSFFAGEIERVFVSSLSEYSGYRKIIEFLAKRHYATRNQIAQHLGVSSSGTITKMLQDLTLSQMIISYVPYQLKEDSLLKRYQISDQYMQFYYRCIKPVSKRIELGDYIDHPTTAFPLEKAWQWLGYSFERWCRANSRIIASKLGFSGIEYQVGAYFQRKLEKIIPGFQLDLVFERADGIISVCELKHTQEPVTLTKIKEFPIKLAAFKEICKKPVQRVLIATGGVDSALRDAEIFDEFITLDDLFS